MPLVTIGRLSPALACITHSQVINNNKKLAFFATSCCKGFKILVSGKSGKLANIKETVSEC